MTARPHPWYATAFGAHYPLLYRHRDATEAQQCLDLLPRLAPFGDGPVLDLGCGQGRHLALLAERGLRAIGLDLSPALLAIARAQNPRGELVRADMRAIPLAARSCSAVLSLFTAFGYFGDARANAPVATEVGRVLQPAGHWFLDFLNSRRVARELAGGPLATERTQGPLRVREERRLVEAPRRVVKEVALAPLPGRDDEAAGWGVPLPGVCYTEEVALLTLDELDALAAAAGLRRVAAAGDYTGAPLDDASPRWLLVYRRDEGGAP
jgi:SAM-dependent methyltransferase